MISDLFRSSINNTIFKTKYTSIYRVGFTAGVLLTCFSTSVYGYTVYSKTADYDKAVIDAIRAGFPGEKDYPDENNAAIKNWVKDYYPVIVKEDPDRIQNELCYAFVNGFSLRSDKLGEFKDIDTLYTIEGLDANSCLAFFSYHVESDGCDKPVPAIGGVYLTIDGDRVKAAEPSDTVVQEYINTKTTDCSSFSDKVNDLYLIATMEYRY